LITMILYKGFFLYPILLSLILTIWLFLLVFTVCLRCDNTWLYRPFTCFSFKKLCRERFVL